MAATGRAGGICFPTRRESTIDLCPVRKSRCVLSARRTVPAVVAFALLVVPAVAAAQGGPGVNRPNLSPGVRFGAGFALSLVVGGILLAVAPRYVDRIIGRIHDDTGTSFLWGVGVLVLFIGSFVLLAITVVGIVIAIPLMIVFVVVAIVGNVLGYLALLAGVVENRWLALVLAAALASLLGAIPVLGNLIGFVVGSLGVGAMARDWRA